MKKFTYLLASLLVAASASAGVRHLTTHATPEVLVDEVAMPSQKVNLPTRAELLAAPVIENSGLSFNLTKGETRSIADMKNAGISQYKPMADRYVVDEQFASFTRGSITNPVSHGSGRISDLDQELRVYGVYDIGDNMALMHYQASVDADAVIWIDNIDLYDGPLNSIEIWAAPYSGQVNFCMFLVAVVNNKANILWQGNLELDADGFTQILLNEAFGQQTNTAYKDLKIAILEENTRDMIFNSIKIDATFGDKWPPVPEPNTPVPGKVTNVSHSIARSKQAFTVNYTGATPATHHEVRCLNDVLAYEPIASMELLHADFSNYKGGTDPYNPSLGAFTANAHVGQFPAGAAHWPVLMDGALGFGHHPQIFDATGQYAGFETGIYDLNATNGVARLYFPYRATIGCGIYFAEWAWDNTTGSWQVIDEFSAEHSLDGNGGLATLLQDEDEWDYFDITLDSFNNLTSHDLSGEVFFTLGVYSVMSYDDLELLGFDSTETAPAEVPVYFYISEFTITVNDVPKGSMFYYDYQDPIQAGAQPITITGDVYNNWFNYWICGVNIVTSGSQAGTAYGPYAEDPNTGTFYVRQLPDELPTPDGDAVDAIVADHMNAVFYNLQGQRVDNPTKGQMYIRQQGGKTTKVVK